MKKEYCDECNSFLRYETLDSFFLIKIIYCPKCKKVFEESSIIEPEVWNKLENFKSKVK